MLSTDSLTVTLPHCRFSLGGMLVSHSQAIVLGRAETLVSLAWVGEGLFVRCADENILRLREDNHRPGLPVHEAVWAEIRAM